jgi:CyaY protein
MDESTFQLRCDAAMDDLFEALSTAADAHGFDVDHNAGTITIEFDEPKAKFVVSPNSPVRQIWLSALTRSFKFEWNEGRGAFALTDSGATLKQTLAEAVGTQLGEPVTLD